MSTIAEKKKEARVENAIHERAHRRLVAAEQRIEALQRALVEALHELDDARAEFRFQTQRWISAAQRAGLLSLEPAPSTETKP